MLADAETRRIAVDYEHGQPLCALAFVGAGKHGVHIGKAAVGYEALMPVEDIFVSDPPRGGFHRTRIGTRIGLGYGKSGEAVIEQHIGKVPALRLASGNEQRLEAEPVCAEAQGEAGIAPGEFFADEAGGHLRYACAAVFFRQVEAVELHPACLLIKLHRELAQLVVFP